MNKELPEIQELLAMRRQSVPGDEYFEEFLSDFHHRQRQDLMKRSARSLLMERVGVWLRELEGAKWVCCAGTAYALVIVALLTWPKGSTEKEGIEPASLEVSDSKGLPFERESPPKKENEGLKEKEF